MVFKWGLPIFMIKRDALRLQRVSMETKLLTRKMAFLIASKPKQNYNKNTKYAAGPDLGAQVTKSYTRLQGI